MKKERQIDERKTDKREKLKIKKGNKPFIVESINGRPHIK